MRPDWRVGRPTFERALVIHRRLRCIHQVFKDSLIRLEGQVDDLNAVVILGELNGIPVVCISPQAHPRVLREGKYFVFRVELVEGVAHRFEPDRLGIGNRRTDVFAILGVEMDRCRRDCIIVRREHCLRGFRDIPAEETWVETLNVYDG